MNDFGINEMLEMQKALQEKYKDKWEVFHRRLERINCSGWWEKSEK